MAKFAHWLRAGNGFIVLGVILLMIGGTSVYASFRGDKNGGEFSDPQLVLITPTSQQLLPTQTAPVQPSVTPVASAVPQTPVSTQASTAKGDSQQATLPASVNFSESLRGGGPEETLPTDFIPQQIMIPAIDLDARVIPASSRSLRSADGTVFSQWEAPNDYAAGWLADSAYLGQVGNTVLSGHHNVYGQVFGRLVELKPGDEIDVFSDGWEFSYMVNNVMILPERDEPLDVRMQNAQWIMPSDDERLTLVTCWPYFSNSHRLIVVATPLNHHRAEAPDISNQPTPRPYH